MVAGKGKAYKYAASAQERVEISQISASSHSVCSESSCCYNMEPGELSGGEEGQPENATDAAAASVPPPSPPKRKKKKKADTATIDIETEDELTARANKSGLSREALRDMESNRFYAGIKGKPPPAVEPVESKLPIYQPTKHAKKAIAKARENQISRAHKPSPPLPFDEITKVTKAPPKQAAQSSSRDLLMSVHTLTVTSSHTPTL